MPTHRRVSLLLAPVRAVALVCVLLAAALGTGCIHLEQTIEITKSGSVLVNYHYSVAEEALPTIATGRKVIQSWQGGKPGDGELDSKWFFNRKAVNRYFVGKGVSVRDYKIYRKNGRRHAEIAVLAKRGLRELNNGRFGDFVVDFTEEGNVRFRADLAEDLDRQPMSVSERARLRALCSDLYLQLVVKVPTTILATSASSSRSTRATWVFDPGQDEAFLRKTPVIDLTFSGDGLKWVPRPKPKKPPVETVKPKPAAKPEPAKEEAPAASPATTATAPAPAPETSAPAAAPKLTELLPPVAEPSVPAEPPEPPPEKRKRKSRWRYVSPREGPAG